MLTATIVDATNGSTTVPTIVLLHGFGAPGDDLVTLAGHLGPARYVFPEAPLPLAGWGNARAWWMIDMEALQRTRGGDQAVRRAEVPEGLAEAREAMLDLLGQLQERYAIPDDKLVLGGFSQGSMLALDLALHRATPIAGLVLWSSTLLAEPVWGPRFERLRALPIALSHGRNDALLPFAAAELLRDRLVAAGAKVEWREFAGGHEIPQVAIAAAANVVTTVAAVS